MSCSAIVYFIEKQVWGLPSLIFIFSVAIYISLQLKFIQLRYITKAINILFSSDVEKSAKVETLSPLQAFINTLGANIGNGSLAGISVAIYSGGPGSVIWLIILSTFAVSLRYAEVFLSTYFVSRVANSVVQFGPIPYMAKLPGGKIWSYLAATLALGFCFVGGSLAQCHAVGLAVYTSLGISQYITALFVLLFIAYIFLGGAQRIVDVLEKMVTLKVFLFLLTAIIILIYHYQSIPNALYIIFYSALFPQAIVGGTLAFALQQSIAVGFQQGVFAGEAGLGTAAVAFSATAGKKPVESGILAMLGVFINIHVVCFLVALCLVASGTWNSGQTSSALIVLTYESVFGTYGGWIVLALVINFAMSVLVAAAFNGRRCWDYVVGSKYSALFPFIFSISSFCGTWMHVDLVWSLNNIVNALLLMVNLCGLLWSIELIKKELHAYNSVNHG